MTPVGAGIRGSLYHSHSFDGWATRMPGWKIVMPSNPLDAYGLMISAIKDPNPVLFLKPKALLRIKGEEKIPGEPKNEKDLKSRIDAPIGDRSYWKPRWPQLKSYEVPIGKAKIMCKGDKITVVSYGRTLPLCVEAAEELLNKNIYIEVIDLRSLYPYDWKLIKKSVQKTKRVLFVNEETEVTNFGEHLALQVANELFYELYAPPKVLAGKNLPGIGLHPHLEENSVPQKSSILEAIESLLEIKP